MMICDLCRKEAPKLYVTVIGARPLENCDACEKDLLVRYREVDKLVNKLRTKLRDEAFADWKKERSALAPGPPTKTV